MRFAPPTPLDPLSHVTKYFVATWNGITFESALLLRAEPVGFYEKAVGAVAIPDSVPGIYTNMLKRD